MNIDLPQDGTEARARMQCVSRAVFGSQFAFEVYAAIARTERVYVSGLAKAAGCEQSYISGLLRRLADQNLLVEESTDEGQRRKYYRVIPSAFWTMVDTWAAEIADREHGGTLSRVA